MAETEVNFVELKPRDLKDYTLIEGFPGMGLVGTIGAKYLIEQLKFKEYGYIDSNIFTPIIRIHDGFPVNPARIYIGEKNKLIVILSEQIIPKVHTQRLAREVVSWMKKKKITKLISLSGIHTEEETTEETVYGIVTNEKLKKKLLDSGINIIEEGVTTGVTSLILLALMNTKIEAISLLGTVRFSADYKAAAQLIIKLNKLLGLNINVKPLLKEAKSTETELLRHLKTLETAQAKVDKFESKPYMYT